MKKEEKIQAAAMEQAGNILNIGLEEKRKSDEIANKPFCIVHGSNEAVYEIPIKKLISSKLLDKVLPLIKSYKNNMLIEFRDTQLIPNGLLSPDKYKAKKSNIDLEDEEIDTKYLTELVKKARELYKDAEFCKTAIYSEDDFEAKLAGTKYGTDRPQARETKRLNIEIIKLIIDAHKLNTDAEYRVLKQLNVVADLLSDYNSDFWQNQDENEVARIANRFRSERL